ARVLPMNGGRISNPQLLLQPRQQTLEPQHVPAAFHPHPHRSAQRLVESLRFSVAVVQPAFGHLTCFCVHHGNLLKARMIITAYNLHVGSFRSELLVCETTKVYSGSGGAVVVIKSSAAPEWFLFSEVFWRGVEGTRRYFLCHAQS